jgi:hypothetical protein
MKTVKLTQPYFYIDRHFEPGQVGTFADQVADDLIRNGMAEDAPNASPINADANPLHDVVDPLVPNADPLHAARALGLSVDEHPALSALAPRATFDRGKGERVRPHDALKPEAKVDPVPPPRGDKAK